MNQLTLSALLSVVVTASGLLAYDRLVVRPAQVVGIVDVAEVYRLKEAEFAALLTSGKTDSDRRRAMDLADAFGKRLPAALDELSSECRCLVVLKSVVVGETPNTRDLTALLKTKVAAR